MTLLALVLAAPLTLYVGPQVKDGFVDIDKGVADSIKDIKGQIPAGLRLVESESKAALKLYVVGRETYSTGSAINTGSGTISNQGLYAGSGMTIGIAAMRVRSLLRVERYERAIAGEGGTYKGAAKDALESVLVWVDANRTRLEMPSPAKP